MRRSNGGQRKRGSSGRIAALLALAATLLFLANSSRLAEPPADRPYLVAHRGLAQDFDRTGLDSETCTAARMLPSGHDYLENTLPSMRAAFALGADAVELDVHWTADGRFAVFHDWTLDCRTNGAGVTRQQTLAHLQALDIGYGYTADGGATHPFRGRGVGLMPSLDEVLAAFPDRDLVIDVKSNDPQEGAALASRLANLPPEQQRRLMVVGGSRPVNAVRQRLPFLRTAARPRLKRCLLRYLALGWSGYLPADCANSLVLVPANYAPWLWGWPNRFLRRMERIGSRVVLLGDYDGSGHSSGFDDPDRLADLPRGYAGGIWTDRIDRIGPAVTEQRE